MQIVDRNAVVRTTPGLVLAGGPSVLPLLIQAVMFAVTMGLYVLAGYLTTRETGTLESGAGAGALAWRMRAARTSRMEDEPGGVTDSEDV